MIMLIYAYIYLPHSAPLIDPNVWEQLGKTHITQVHRGKKINWNSALWRCPKKNMAATERVKAMEIACVFSVSALATLGQPDR